MSQLSNSIMWSIFVLQLCILTTTLVSANLHYVHLTKDTRSKSMRSYSHDTNSAPLPWLQLQQKLKTGNANLQRESGWTEERKDITEVLTSDDTPPTLLPNQPAEPFQLFTLAGVLEYPSSTLANVPIIIHTFDNHSAFLECLWTSNSSLDSLVTAIPDTGHYVFVPTSDYALGDALWMKGQIDSRINQLKKYGKISTDAIVKLQSRLHYAITSAYQLGNWIPTLLQDWACQDHGCGLQQAVFRSLTSSLSQRFGMFSSNPSAPIVLKRLDARYDWLPSPSSFGNKTLPIAPSGDGCHKDDSVAKKIAVVTAGGCSFSAKVTAMQASQALAVVVYADMGQPVQDMNCVGSECDQPPSIPATMIPYNQDLVNLLQTKTATISFQTTTAENFYFGIDSQGLLQEMGWLLYPSFQFFNWQVEWFNFKTSLLANLSRDAMVIPIINNTVMQGENGIVANIQLPNSTKMPSYNKLELDASLSCPGTRDETCPPWDHTVNLYLCCNETSPLCNMELGRWITPFRRRIGRWLTDVSPLFPLFTSNNCTFTMKTVSWAKAWVPSLSLRYSTDPISGPKPYDIKPLFRGGTFNQTYNKKYTPYYFTTPPDVTKVQIYAVITGHGSDNNGCGEFCVTSHHFVVNGYSNNITFNTAGTPLGCALRTPTGVEPNEHGTWLYGRDGWCDGREVDPWVFNITMQLNMTTGQNKITYFGWFDGKDPNPTENPGYIIMYSYLVFYK